MRETNLESGTTVALKNGGEGIVMGRELSSTSGGPTKYPALRPAKSSVCIIMVCTDASEADQVGQQLSQMNAGYLVTYRRVQDLMHNAPAGTVALIILSTQDEPVVTGRTLQWLRNRWPRCPITVVGAIGGSDQEMAAREGGACYLTRPVDGEQWRAILSHALGRDQHQEEPSRRLD